MGSRKFRIKRPEQLYSKLDKKYNPKTEKPLFSLSRFVRRMAVASFIVFNAAILVISLATLALLSTVFESNEGILTLHQEMLDRASYQAVDYMIDEENLQEVDYLVIPGRAVANVGDEAD